MLHFPAPVVCISLNHDRLVTKSAAKLVADLIHEGPQAASASRSWKELKNDQIRNLHIFCNHTSPPPTFKIESFGSEDFHFKISPRNQAGLTEEFIFFYVKENTGKLSEGSTLVSALIIYHLLFAKIFL